MKRSTHEPFEHWYQRLSNRLWTHALSGISRPSVLEKHPAPPLGPPYAASASLANVIRRPDAQVPQIS